MPHRPIQARVFRKDRGRGAKTGCNHCFTFFNFILLFSLSAKNPACPRRQTHKVMWCHVARPRPIFVVLCITPFHNKFKFLAGCIIFSAYFLGRGGEEETSFVKDFDGVT